MRSLRLVGWLGALLITVLAIGGLAGVGTALATAALPLAAAASTLAVVAGVALLVVAVGGGAARTRTSTYW